MDLRKVTHVIFDMDGLLLDTERLEATQNVFNQFGITFTWEVKITLLGLQKEEVARRITEIYNLPITWEEYLEQSHAECVRLMSDSPLLPGAEKLVRHLHANKVPICLATSSGADMVEIKTKKHKELFALFDHKVCGSTDPEVKQGKPSPDIFIVAAQRFPDSPNPTSCLVFEDAPNGVKAALAAGMQAVMVPVKNVPAEQRQEANVVFESLEDVRLEDFGLPPLPK